MTDNVLTPEFGKSQNETETEAPAVGGIEKGFQEAIAHLPNTRAFNDKALKFLRRIYFLGAMNTSKTLVKADEEGVFKEALDDITSEFAEFTLKEIKELFAIDEGTEQ